MAKILIIDDDLALCKLMDHMLGYLGHKIEYAHTFEGGLQKALSTLCDLVFIDVRLPDGNGLDLLPKLRIIPSSPEIIIITGQGDPNGAELAIHNGAWDYINKPFSRREITLQVIRSLQYREEKQKNRVTTIALKKNGIIGESIQIKTCLELLANAADNDANVLISGESGTGKELFSRAIHKNSPRANSNFIVIDCAALPATLIESILFGHEKGAFTGADKPEEGLIKQADRGTLFLDEVGELPIALQKVFLRVLQEHRFRPVGGKREIQSDFRLVAATNQDLDQMVNTGKFRQDLLFRLRSVVIDLPPLRERTEDIMGLAMHFMVKSCRRNGLGTKGFSPEFFEMLTGYSWPGNVRELMNAIDRAVATAKNEPTLFPIHLPLHIRSRLARDSVKQKDRKSTTADSSPSFQSFREFRNTAVADAENKYLGGLLQHANGDIREACNISQLSRSRLYGLLKKHNLSGPN